MAIVETIKGPLSLTQESVKSAMVLLQAFTKDVVSHADSVGDDDIEIHIDMSELDWTEPFSILLYSRSVNQLAKSYSNKVKFGLVNFSTSGYPVYMGFYRAMGVAIGPELNSLDGSSTHIPVGFLDILKIKKDAAYYGIAPGELIQDKADEFTDVFVNGGVAGKYAEMLKYCFREILRNSVEHSDSNKVWYCIQYWPKWKRVEIGILDEGCGLYESLRKSEELMQHISSVEDAIALSIAPGVTRTLEQPDFHNNEWQNSGYGLYFTKKIAEKSGEFTVLSDGHALGFNRKNESKFEMPVFEGTAIKLKINLDEIENWDLLLNSIRSEAREEVKAYSYIKGLKTEPSGMSKG